MPAPCGAKERGNCQRSRSGGGGRSARRTWGGQGPRREDHARRGVVGSHKLVKVVRRQRLRTDIRIRVRGQRAASGPRGPSRPGGGGGGGCAGRRAAHGEVRRGGNQLVPQSAGEGGDVDRLCERGAALGQTGAAGETEAAPRLRRGAAPPGGRKPEAGFASISTLCGLASSAARSAFTFASCSQPTGESFARSVRQPPHTPNSPPWPSAGPYPRSGGGGGGGATRRVLDHVQVVLRVEHRICQQLNRLRQVRLRRVHRVRHLRGLGRVGLGWVGWGRRRRTAEG